MTSVTRHAFSKCYKAISRSLTSEEMLLAEKTFQVADEGKKEFLNKDDIQVAAMILFGYKLSKSEVLKLLSSFGSQQVSGEIGLNLSHFKEAMRPKFTVVDLDEEIRNTFMAFDKNCRGFLIVEDVKTVFSQVCPHFPEQQVELVFRELDRDGDGRISYKDFDFMMKFDNAY